MTTREDKARAIIDQRSYGGRCEVCGRLGTNVHHVRKEGRVWAPSNLLRLCGSGTTGCHGWIESHPAHAMALHLWVTRDSSGVAPVWCAPIMFKRGWWIPDDAGMWTYPDVEPEDTPEVVAAKAALEVHLMSRARMG